jgi:uncharacterized protein YfaP (DUF2135 family)
MSKFFKALMCFAFLAFLLGCSAAKDAVNPPPPPPDNPTTYIFGENKITNTKSVGNAGGTLSIAEGPLNGAVVNFPAGSLPANNQVEIGYNKGKLGTDENNALIINVSNNKNFSKPILITLPFEGSADDVPVPFYVDDAGVLSVCQLVSIDRVNKTYTFTTLHASTYITKIANNSSEVLSTNFKPDSDGFQVVNDGSDYTFGDCFGMTSFSQWYFKNKKGDGNFFPRFMYVIGKDNRGLDLHGQDIIATRTQNSLQNSFYFQLFSNNRNLTNDSDTFSLIKTSLRLTKKPVIVNCVAQINGSDAYHSVLFYKLNGDTFEFYDPNNPAQVQQLKYNTSTKTFNSYVNNGYTFNEFRLIGDGSINVYESFDFIYQDAIEKFNQAKKAEIHLTSHEEGGTIHTLIPVLKGKTQSVEMSVKKIVVNVNGRNFETNVVNDEFELPISLKSGSNLLYFRTFGRDTNNVEVEIPNNWGATPFEIVVDVPLSKALVTLTWNTLNSDLDLYVVDPNNDYSCYYNKETDDGGELDRDDTDGLGPEHWTLMKTDTIRYNQPYKIRVHYYRKNSDIPAVNYVVSVKTDEGTNKERTIDYHGTLTFSDSENDGPNDTGSDWADVATFTLTGGSNVISSQSIRNRVNVVVPSREQRKALKK